MGDAWRRRIRQVVDCPIVYAQVRQTGKDECPAIMRNDPQDILIQETMIPAIAVPEDEFSTPFAPVSAH